jgi:hypothetical protein
MTTTAALLSVLVVVLFTARIARRHHLHREQVAAQLRLIATVR